MGRYRKHTKEQLAEAVKLSTHMNDLAEKLGYSNGYTYLKRYIQQDGLDTSHWVKHKKRHYPSEVIRVQQEDLRSHVQIRKRLFAVRGGNRCELCGLRDEWQSKPLTLQVHHIDGSRQNNSFDNLQILCPNCHSQTENYGNKKRDSTIKV